jgi:heat shock protein beta
VGGLDCNDTDAGVHPDADEIWYDGIDQDCDGWDDHDQDRDGWAVDPFAGETHDCDDLSAATHPGATEIYDGLDNDCDGHTELDDRDADGLLDWDEWHLGTDPTRSDTDGDGWLDGFEVGGAHPELDVWDTDGDGVIDALDTDDDGDGILTVNEQSEDVDGDGFADPDVDGDGLPNGRDVDADGDGFLDRDEGEIDRDGDGIPAYLDHSGEFRGGGCSTAPLGRTTSMLWLVGLLALGRRREQGA